MENDKTKELKKTYTIFGITVPTWVVWIPIALFILPGIVFAFVLWTTKSYLFLFKDYLAYFGSIVAFLGTVILAFVALKQNNSAVDTNKKLAKANEELVELTKKMQDIQMAQNEAEYGIFKGQNIHLFKLPINPDNRPISELLKKEYETIYNVTVKFLLKSIKGYGFDIELKFEKLMFSQSNPALITQNMFLHKELEYIETDMEPAYYVSHYAQEIDVENLMAIPCDKVDNYKSLILKISLKHRDIYNKIHKEILHVVYGINLEDKQLDYYSYHIYSDYKRIIQ